MATLKDLDRAIEVFEAADRGACVDMCGEPNYPAFQFALETMRSLRHFDLHAEKILESVEGGLP